MDKLTVTEDGLNELQNAYNRAVDKGDGEFDFKGHTLLVDYAKYLIEYLVNKFKESKNANN